MVSDKVLVFFMAGGIIMPSELSDEFSLVNLLADKSRFYLAKDIESGEYYIINYENVLSVKIADRALVMRSSLVKPTGTKFN